MLFARGWSDVQLQPGVSVLDGRERTFEVGRGRERIGVGVRAQVELVRIYEEAMGEGVVDVQRVAAGGCVVGETGGECEVEADVVVDGGGDVAGGSEDRHGGSVRAAVCPGSKDGRIRTPIRTGHTITVLVLPPIYFQSWALLRIPPHQAV